MRDIQNDPSKVALPIDRVGVKELSLPIVVRDRAKGIQHTVASVDIGADLPAQFKGTHMSRFVEVLKNFSEELDYPSVKRLLQEVIRKLRARKAFVVFRFPYFLQKAAPATGEPGLMAYQCRLTGELAEGGDKPSFRLEVDVPVMTVCPCSKAISDEGAHSQRAVVRIQTLCTGFLWLEELIDIAENAASSPVYTLLKRQDEKKVTEDAFANPTFVEDVVRQAAKELTRHPLVAWYSVEVESFESIHNHNAFASISATSQEQGQE